MTPIRPIIVTKEQVATTDSEDRCNKYNASLRDLSAALRSAKEGFVFLIIPVNQLVCSKCSDRITGVLGSRT